MPGGSLQDISKIPGFVFEPEPVGRIHAGIVRYKLADLPARDISECPDPERHERQDKNQQHPVPIDGDELPMQVCAPLSHVNHPPIEYMGRGGGTKCTLLISCPIHFPRTFARMAAAISSSPAPGRSSGLISPETSAGCL